MTSSPPTVAALRSFEATYRANLTDQLRSQIESLESGRAEPAEVPDVVAISRPTPTATTTMSGNDGDAPAERDESARRSVGGSPTSNTPRLDALLGDQR